MAKMIVEKLNERARTILGDGAPPKPFYMFSAIAGISLLSAIITYTTHVRALSTPGDFRAPVIKETELKNLVLYGDFLHELEEPEEAFTISDDVTHVPLEL